MLENSCRADEHDCPFARASIELTNILCEILNVGELRNFSDSLSQVMELFLVESVLRKVQRYCCNFLALSFGFAATDEGQVYYPMFFTNDRPFEEFYCIAIQLLNKTWKEMKATSEDFTKVTF